PSADVLVQNDIEEERVELVPLETGRGPLQVARRSLAGQESVPGDGKGEAISLPRQEEAGVPPHRLRGRKGTLRMLGGELVPGRLHLGLRGLSVRPEERVEAGLRRLRFRGRHPVTLLAPRASSRLAGSR